MLSGYVLTPERPLSAELRIYNKRYLAGSQLKQAEKHERDYATKV